MMFKFAACLCFAGVLGHNWALDAHPLRPTEQYLAPYLDDVLDYRKNIWSLGVVGLTNLLDAVPTSVEDFIIGRFVPGGQVSVPVNTSVDVVIPAGAGTVDMTFLVHYATLGGLNAFQTFQPLKLAKDGRFTWTSKIDLDELPLAAKTELQEWGLAVEIVGAAAKPSIHFDVVMALNHTKLRSMKFAWKKAPLKCAIWAIAADDDAAVLGLNVTSVKLDLADVNADFNITGGTFGKDWNDQFAQNLKDALDQAKPDLIANLSTLYSEKLRGLANDGLLQLIPKMQHDQPCMPESLNSIIV